MPFALYACILYILGKEEVDALSCPILLLYRGNGGFFPVVDHVDHDRIRFISPISIQNTMMNE